MPNGHHGVGDVEGYRIGLDLGSMDIHVWSE